VINRSACRIGAALMASAFALSVVPAASAASLHASPRARLRPRARVLDLVLPLRTNVAGLTRFADAVTNPGSPDYGHYRSVAWLSAHYGATLASRERVTSYLREHGASHVRVDATGQYVYASIKVSSAERTFDTSEVAGGYARGARVLRSSAPVILPAALRGRVTGVIGLDTAPIARSQTLAPSSGYAGPDPTATPSGCAAGLRTGGFTPNEYLDAYDYTPLQQKGLLGQGERVALIEIDGFKPSDIRSFAHCFGFGTPEINSFGVGVQGNLPAGGEATLDLEVLDATAPDLKSIDVYETQPDAADVLRAIAEPLQNRGFKPQVISVSLGLCESATVAGAGRGVINATETALKVAAASGISVLGASGDFGSSGCAQPGTVPAKPEPHLAVNYPASSPWVTSVGGTNFTLNAQNQITSQTVWNEASEVPGEAAGGGFSNLFTRPSWQNGVVTSPWRAEPDVAMLADVAPGYAVYCTAAADCMNQGWVSFGGTSASTPLMAGGLALIDQLLRRNDRQSVGFIDPLLYRLGRNATTFAQTFYDVSAGSNDVGPYIQADQQSLGCCTAAAGFDEASGWGGINLYALSQAALAAEPVLAQVTMKLPGGQRPYAAKGIYVQVSCSGACDMGAYARVTVPGGTTFTDYASLVHVDGPSSRRLKIPFTGAQLRELNTALKDRRHVIAVVAGAIFDAAGNVERHAPPHTLKITR
jgi:kumamolisin